MATPVEPGGERGAAVEARDPADDRDHRLLGRVERVLAVGDDAAAERMDAVGVAFEELFERGPIAARRETRELGVVVTQP